jgi:hypothetical protein
MILNLQIFKMAAVISVLMKVYTIPCQDTGHINVMLVLQSCTDSLHIEPGLSSEMYPTSSDGTNGSSIEVEEDVRVIEEGFVAINEQVAVRIKQEEIPGDINLPDVKSEPEEVIYVCVCLLLDTFHQCPEMSFVFVIPIYLANLNSYTVQNKNVFL